MVYILLQKAWEIFIEKVRIFTRAKNLLPKNIQPGTHNIRLTYMVANISITERIVGEN